MEKTPQFLIKVNHILLEVPPENQPTCNNFEDPDDPGPDGSPRQLVNKLENYIKDYLDNKYIGNTFRDYGYIKDVRLIGYTKGLLSRITSFPMYKVEFIIECIKPEIGQIVEAYVKVLNQEFITLKVEDGINIVIVRKFIESKGFKYNQDGFYQKKEKKKDIRIEYDSLVKVKITNIKYTTVYLCTGDLVDVV